MVVIKTAVPGISEPALARFTHQAAKAAGLRGQVDVLVTSSRQVRALNRRFRGHDQPTDVSHDHDYTDWDAVERFGRDFAAQVAATAAPAR